MADTCEQLCSVLQLSHQTMLPTMRKMHLFTTKTAELLRRRHSNLWSRPRISTATARNARPPPRASNGERRQWLVNFLAKQLRPHRVAWCHCDKSLKVDVACCWPGASLLLLKHVAS